MDIPYLNLHIITTYMDNYDISKILKLSKYYFQLINDNWVKISYGILDKTYGYKRITQSDNISFKRGTKCISLPNKKQFVLNFLRSLHNNNLKI